MDVKEEQLKRKTIRRCCFCSISDDRRGKYYLDMAPANDLKNQWIKPADNDPLNDKNVSKFISDKEGLVTTGQRFLPSGTYYFEELKGVEGYEMDEASKRIESSSLNFGWMQKANHNM